MRQLDQIRRGLSLVEVVVVIGLICLCTTLFIPVVSGVRESARRELCTARLKQLGQAVSAFASDRGGFPGCYTYVRDATGLAFVGSTSTHAGLLPHLDLLPLYTSLNFSVMQSCTVDPANQTASLAVVQVFLCPSDTLVCGAGQGSVNYRVNLGRGGARRFSPHDPRGNLVPEILSDHDGAFAASPTTSATEYRDGTSQTLAFSEKLVGSGDGIYHPWRDWVDVSPAFAITPAEWVQTCSQANLRTSGKPDGGSLWLDPATCQSGFLVSARPNTDILDCGQAGTRPAGVFAARSMHPEGVNGVLLDGSVRFFKNSIKPAVWSALGTRAGAELISAADYGL